MFETREAFSLLKKKNNPEVVTQHFVQYLHIENTREKSWPCCCALNLLACPGPNRVDPICFWREREGVRIEIAVIIIKIQAIK